MDTTQLQQFLNSITPMAYNDFKKSKTYFKSTMLQKGEVWINYHTVCREIAFINKGLLKASYYDERGHDVTSCFCTPNSMASSFRSEERRVGKECSDVLVWEE